MQQSQFLQDLREKREIPQIFKSNNLSPLNLTQPSFFPDHLWSSVGGRSTWMKTTRQENRCPVVVRCPLQVGLGDDFEINFRPIFYLLASISPNQCGFPPAMIQKKKKRLWNVVGGNWGKIKMASKRKEIWGAGNQQK